MIRKGKNQEQEKTLANINILFNGRKDAINFIEGYGSMILETRKKAGFLKLEKRLLKNKKEQNLKYYY